MEDSGSTIVTSASVNAAVECVNFQWPGRRRRLRELPPRSRSISVVLLPAALTALCFDASHGLLLPHGPSTSKPLRPAAAGITEHMPRVSRFSAPAPRRRCRLLPRRCAGRVRDDDRRCSTGAAAAGGAASGAAAAVHTLLIDNYDSYTYNLFQLLAVVNGQAPFVVFNDDDGGDMWRAIERMGRVPDNIVISPGPGRPDVPKDFGMCAQALREAIDIPILGVCLGHEGLGIANGARVVRAAAPMHGRLSKIFHDGEDALFKDVPQGSSVVRYHSLVVDRGTLSAAGGALKATAWTADGVLMAMRHEERPHWGVQFHPESVGTRHGLNIIRNFRDLTVAWRGVAAAAAAAARESSGSGGGDRDIGLLKRRVMSAMEASSRTQQNSWGGSPTVGVKGAAEGPASASWACCRDPAESAEAASAPVPDAIQAAAAAAAAAATTTTKTTNPPSHELHRKCSVRSTARRRPPFVLHVAEVDMAGAPGVEGTTDTTGTSNRRVGEAPGSTFPDTERAFRALYSDDATAWWLDSSSQRPGVDVDGQAKARFTFMGGADGPLSQIIECYGKGRLVVQQGGAPGGGGGRRRRRQVRANIMDYLKAEMAKMGHVTSAGGTCFDDDRHGQSTTNSNSRGGPEIRLVGERPKHTDATSVGGSVGADRVKNNDDDDDDDRRVTLPFDFCGGFVGFLGYELRHEANDVLERSAGGTEWNWQPPEGGRWEDATFEGEEVVGSDPVVHVGDAAPEALTGVMEGGGRGGSGGVGACGAGAFRGDAGGNGSGGAGEVGDVPSGFLVFADRFVAFDHQEGKAYVLALSHADVVDAGNGVGVPTAAVAVPDTDGSRGGSTATSIDDESAQDDGLDWIERTAASLRSLFAGEDVEERRRDSITATTSCSMDVPRSRYERSLEEIMRLVEEGETYEVCLTNQIVCERPKGAGLEFTPPLDLYSRLRRLNPAPYAAYIVHDPHRRFCSATGGDVGEEQEAEQGGGGPAFAVCCSSPEKFLKVDGNGWVESKPIKGTAKRGKTPAEDFILATDLAEGEKNMAENLMIVDLVRNDLGRVCQTGSVSVPKLMHVESYATVHQLVSTIRGRLKPDCGALDAIAAAFPGGSMTGAPKQRTMEIIDRLEQGRPRGVYSGSIGFLGVDGAADLNIVIRTAVVTPRNVTVGAGGAVIALSEVNDEYEEMLLKAASVLGALGHNQRPGRRGPPGSEPTGSTSSLPQQPGNVGRPAGDGQGVVRDSKSSANGVIGGRRLGVRSSFGEVDLPGTQQVQHQQQRQ